MRRPKLRKRNMVCATKDMRARTRIKFNLCVYYPFINLPRLLFQAIFYNGGNTVLIYQFLHSVTNMNYLLILP